MDSTHIHLITNHIPVLTTIFSDYILGWGLFRSDKSYQEIALVGFIIAGIFSIVAMQSGEGAEDLVENIPGISESFIHDHEEVAEITNWVAVAMALASLAAFWMRAKKYRFFNGYLKLLLVGGILSGTLFSYTAYQGGQIRHTEIRADSAGVQQAEADEEGSSETDSEMP